MQGRQDLDFILEKLDVRWILHQRFFHCIFSSGFAILGDIHFPEATLPERRTLSVAVPLEFQLDSQRNTNSVPAD